MSGMNSERPQRTSRLRNAHLDWRLLNSEQWKGVKKIEAYTKERVICIYAEKMRAWLLSKLLRNTSCDQERRKWEKTGGRTGGRKLTL